MKKYSIGIILLILISGFSFTLSAQVRTLHFTLDDVIRIAKEQSPRAIMARHRFRSSYWEFRTHKAKFRPSLSLQGTLPNLNRSIEPITLDDGSDAFLERSVTNYSLSAFLRQNIGAALKKTCA